MKAVAMGVRRVVQRCNCIPLDFDNIKIYVKSKIRLALVGYLFPKLQQTKIILCIVYKEDDSFNWSLACIQLLRYRLLPTFTSDSGCQSRGL